jgi:hypothetical protein
MHTEAAAALPQHDTPADRAGQMLASAAALYGPGGAAQLPPPDPPRPLHLGLRPEFNAAEQAEYERRMVGAWHKDVDGQPLSTRRRQALRSALVYITQLLHAGGEHARVQAAGLTTELEDALLGGFEREAVELQQLVVLAELTDGETLGKLARGRLAALLMSADSAHEWWLIARTLKTLPQWILGPGQADELRVKVARRDRSAPGHPQFDYPASDPQAAAALREQLQPLSRPERRRIQALLRKEARRQERAQD